MQRLNNLTINRNLTASGNQSKDERDEASKQAWRDFQITFTFLVLTIGIGFVVLWWQKIGNGFIATLFALACLASGGIIGFLFGIPRVLQKEDVSTSVPASSDSSEGSQVGQISQAPYRMLINTNLEQISDWLTKIIVGIGLIELRRLPENLNRLSIFVAGGIGDQPQSQVFATGLIIYFTVLGFLGGYLITRIYLTGAFYRADWGAQTGTKFFAAMRSKVEKEAQQILENDPEAAKRITEEQIQVAEQIEKFAAHSDISMIRQQIKALAREYEQIRASMPAGDERTRRMEVVATKMRTLALAASPLLPELMNSPLAGERLAAVIILQVSPKPNYLLWLAKRLEAEKPFVGYHATVALLSAARTLDRSHRPAILEAIRVAKEGLGSDSMGTDRWKVLADAERELTQQAIPTNEDRVFP